MMKNGQISNSSRSHRTNEVLWDSVHFWRSQFVSCLWWERTNNDLVTFTLDADICSIQGEMSSYKLPFSSSRTRARAVWSWLRRWWWWWSNQPHWQKQQRTNQLDRVWRKESVTEQQLCRDLIPVDGRWKALQTSCQRNERQQNPRRMRPQRWAVRIPCGGSHPDNRVLCRHSRQLRLLCQVFPTKISEALPLSPSRPGYVWHGGAPNFSWRSTLSKVNKYLKEIKESPKISVSLAKRLNCLAFLLRTSFLGFRRRFLFLHFSCTTK